MAQIASHPQLRIVGTDDPATLASWDSNRRARQDVIKENRLAAHQPMAPTDPRWVLAARAYSQLEGTMLTPDRRQRVLKTARAIGVRPFDATLIIAIVQDQARAGRPLADAEPSLSMLPAPRARTRNDWTRWLAALGVAAAATVVLIRWLIAG